MDTPTKDTERVAESCPLSPMQQGLLFPAIAAPHSEAYSVQLQWHLIGPLDLCALTQAWTELATRHAILRASFHWEGLEAPVQRFGASVQVPFVMLDWRRLEADEQSQCLKAFLADERARRFDLTCPPLFRLAAVRLGEERHRLICTIHHILVDGWSTTILREEWLSLYESFLGGTPADLPPAYPFRDYVTWVQRQDRRKANEYWQSAMHGFAEPTPLGLDRGTPGDSGYATVERCLDRNLTVRLGELAWGLGVTANTVLQGAWALVLANQSGRSDVLHGMTVAGRPHDLPGVESMVGPLINTLPLRVHVAPDLSLRAWLTGLHDQIAQLSRYSYAKLVEIQSCTQVPRWRALFQSVVVYEYFPEPMLRGSLGGEWLDPVQATDTPLTVMAVPGPELRLRMYFDRRRFAAAHVEELVLRLASTLAQMATGAERPLEAFTSANQGARQAHQLESPHAVRRGELRHNLERMLTDLRARTLGHSDAGLDQDLCAPGGPSRSAI